MHSMRVNMYIVICYHIRYLYYDYYDGHEFDYDDSSMMPRTEKVDYNNDVKADFEKDSIVDPLQTGTYVVQ